MLDEAADVGLLAIDRERRELRFEGDRERYRIPAAAIEELSMDGYQLRGLSAKHFIVLRVATEGGSVELPLARRFAPFWTGVRRGQQRCAMELFARVLEIAISEEPEAGAGPWPV